MLTHRFTATALAATTALLLSSPARADFVGDGDLDPCTWTLELWAGVHDGQFADVYLDGETLEPRLNLWLMGEDFDWDFEAHACMLSMVVSSSEGTSDLDAWYDWEIQVDPPDVFGTNCEYLDPEWVATNLPTITDWVTEVVIESIDPWTAADAASWGGDWWASFEDWAFGGDFYEQYVGSMTWYQMRGYNPFFGVAWQVDDDLDIVDDDLDVSDGGNFVEPTDVAAGADGYYWLSTGWAFEPFPCEDVDGDWVCDVDDDCDATVLGDISDEHGCSVADTCPCEGGWRNHGAYVSCVARALNDFVPDGPWFVMPDKGAVQSAAASSDCGR